MYGTTEYVVRSVSEQLAITYSVQANRVILAWTSVGQQSGTRGGARVSESGAPFTHSFSGAVAVAVL